MKKILFILSFLICTAAMATESEKELFQLLNLERPALKQVKSYALAKDYQGASKALLEYFRDRKNIKHPDVNPWEKDAFKGTKLPDETLEKANRGMKHEFFVHKGYGYFDFGEDINWQYWPVKDNEIRWQLNRMYWWIPMGQAYWSTGNEKYAKEWIWQFRDWVKDNPRGLSVENDRFAWRQLETARRVQDQTNLFNYFLDSPHFTPEFLIEFLINYHTHVERVREQYSERGNHLLFEAQRMIYAGAFFPEFKNSPYWRKEGIDILNREIVKQVYDDGLQYELSLNYHIGTINIFLRALHMAQLCNMESEFPATYINTVEKMISAAINFSFPDYSYPMFSDAKKESYESMLAQYKEWFKVFPENKELEFFASEGNKGYAPKRLSNGLRKGGIYTFRNGWDKQSTIMVVKASPPAFWHSQPDNGTFELWVKGRNFMPDAGCYVYGGDEEIMKLRNWYRQTKVHQTLTLNNEDLACNARLLHWSTGKQQDQLTYENPSYENLTHKRTILFVDQKFFVLIDNATGDAVGNIDLHYHFIEGEAVYNEKETSVRTNFADHNNIYLRCFSDQPIQLIKEEGKVSYSYRQEQQRPAFAFHQKKPDKKTIRFITVIYPYHEKQAPVINARFIPPGEKELQKIELKINGVAKTIELMSKF